MIERMVEQNMILQGVVGSTLHGLNVPGQDDQDFMGICIEPPAYVIGLRHFEHLVTRTKPEGVRSEAGDIDRTIYSLRKYVRLALKGNPSVQLLLWHPSPDIITREGKELQENASRFYSQRLGKAFLGYLTAQKERLLGVRGQMDVHRPELIEKYGYDVKYAMHMLRLGYQGIEMMATQRLTLPIREPERSMIYKVRIGEVKLERVIWLAEAMTREIERLIPDAPVEPDYAWADQFLIRAYEEYWNKPFGEERGYRYE